MADIASIPGIALSEVQFLAGLNLFTSDDLLRTHRSALAAKVPGLTVARVRTWQAWAELVQIRDLPEAVAGALLAAGADGVEEVAGWTLARARAALPGKDDEAILGWIRDAMRLTHTGVLNGNVRLADGTPVDSAAVTVAGRAAVSDARGRFRVIRLPLDQKPIVTVHHPALGYRLAQEIPVFRSSALVGQTFVLSGRPAKPKVLTELRGDKLPPIGGAPISTRVEPGGPDQTDILMVIDRHPNGDARAASRFLDFEAGRFVRRVYRMASGDLPAGLQDGDDLEWTGTGWARARYSGLQIARMVRLRAVYRRLPKPPLNAQQSERAARAILKALSDPKG